MLSLSEYFPSRSILPRPGPPSYSARSSLEIPLPSNSLTRKIRSFDAQRRRKQNSAFGHQSRSLPAPDASSTVLLNLANRLRRGHRHALVLRVALKLGPEFTHYSHYGSYMPSTKSNLGTRDVGRPTKWGNPYKVGASHHTAEEAVNPYRRDLIAGSLPFTIDDARRELKGEYLIAGANPALLVMPMC